MSNEKQKPVVIPKKVQEMADFVKDCDEKGLVPMIIQKRGYGKTAALRLARQTEDADFEIIEPKKISNE